MPVLKIVFWIVFFHSDPHPPSFLSASLLVVLILPSSVFEKPIFTMVISTSDNQKKKAEGRATARASRQKKAKETSVPPPTPRRKKRTSTKIPLQRIRKRRDPSPLVPPRFGKRRIGKKDMAIQLVSICCPL